jgi:hypothetical protein
MTKYIGITIIFVSILSAFFGGDVSFALGSIYGVSVQWVAGWIGRKA